MFCNHCGYELQDVAVVCTRCGAPVKPVVGTNQKSKLVAGLLGIFLGWLGIHNFYLGYNTKGVIQLILTVASCGVSWIWGFVEGILIICGNINVDASGVPLKD